LLTTVFLQANTGDIWSWIGFH